MWYPHIISPSFIFETYIPVSHGDMCLKYKGGYHIPTHLYLGHISPYDMPTHLYVRQCDIPIWYPHSFMIETTWYPHMISPLIYIWDIHPRVISPLIYIWDIYRHMISPLIYMWDNVISPYDIPPHLYLRQRGIPISYSHSVIYWEIYPHVIFLLSYTWDATYLNKKQKRYHVAHSRWWHDTFACATWLIDLRDMTHSHVWRDSSTCGTWHIRMCDVTHSHLWHDAFTCVTWLSHICGMTHSNARKDSFRCVAWLIYMCDSNTIQTDTVWTRLECNTDWHRCGCAVYLWIHI